MSLVGRLRRRRREVPPAAGHRQLRWATAGEFVRAAGQAAGVTRVGIPAAGPPLQQICADLHRINGEIAKVLADPRLPGRYQRLVAASLAYDAALTDACRAIGVDPPQRRPLDQYNRLETEATLTAHGLKW